MLPIKAACQNKCGSSKIPWAKIFLWHFTSLNGHMRGFRWPWLIIFVLIYRTQREISLLRMFFGGAGGVFYRLSCSFVSATCYRCFLRFHVVSQTETAGQESLIPPVSKKKKEILLRCLMVTLVAPLTGRPLCRGQLAFSSLLLPPLPSHSARQAKWMTQ